jgi:hypothetical protein
MPTYLIDGTTPLPENGETGWGNKLNAAITSIDDRFTWTSGEAVVEKVAASGITGTTLPATLTSSSLTSVGTLTSLNVSGAVVVTGDLTVNGTTTTINSTTLAVDDKNIELGSITSPTDTSANGGGITLKGATDKTLNWVQSTTAWTSSEDFNLLAGKVYEINGTSVLSATTLGSGVTGSSLTGVGTIGTGTWQGTAIAGQYGGTGVANTGKTITVSGNTAIGSSTDTVTLATSGNTSVTLPTAGTLSTLAGSESLTNKKLGSLTTNGLVTTSSGDGTLTVTSMGSGVATFLATPSSANLASAVSDETGSGALVFGTSPTFTTSVLTDSSTFSLINTAATTVNFAGAATTLSIGSASGTTTINNGLTVAGPTVLGPAVITQQSAGYTLVLTDAGDIIEMTNSSAATVTIPPNASVAFPVGTQIVVIRNASGTVQFQAGAGVTLRSDASKFFISTQYSAATLVKRGTDEWYLIGNLSAS